MQLSGISEFISAADKRLLLPAFGADAATLPFPVTPGIARLLRMQTGAVEMKRAFYYGTPEDGVIEAAPLVGAAGKVEVGYYFGALKPKGIMKISAQIGCAAECKFCELGDAPLKGNVPMESLKEQVAVVAQIVSFVEPGALQKPQKVSIAGSGEPLLNPALPEFVQWLGELGLSVKVSTVFPLGGKVLERLAAIGTAAEQSPASTQLQVSLISTDERYRRAMAGPLASPFSRIREGAEQWHDANPRGRRVNLSLILAAETPADVAAVREIFPAQLFRFRFRNYVPTLHGSKHGLAAIPDEKMRRIKEEFLGAGYEVTDDATPTATEQRFGLASNVTLIRDGGPAL